MKNKLLVICASVIAISMLALSIFLPSQTAFASDTQPTTGPWKQTLESVRQTLQTLPTQDPIFLSNLLKREQIALSNQEIRLSSASQVAQTTQAYIDEQKAQGEDTSTLESVLSNFNTAINTAQGYHDTAASILKTPAGFDTNGQVTDQQIARQTVRSAAQALRQAHLTLTEASLNLRLAVKDFRSANKAN